MISLNDLRRSFRGILRLNEPASRYCLTGMGGPADYYIEPATKNDLVHAVGFLKRNDIPFALIGARSPALVGETGFRGALINIEPGVSLIVVRGTTVYAEIGVTASALVEFLAQRSLEGLEALAGRPGTLHEFLRNGSLLPPLATAIRSVDLIREGVPMTGLPESLQTGDTIMAVTLQLASVPREDVYRLRRNVLLARNAAEPLNIPRSMPLFEDHNDARAGELLERAGMAGSAVGMASLSVRHPNLLMLGVGASSRDVLSLIRRAREAVLRETGRRLELRLRLIGIPEPEEEPA